MEQFVQIPVDDLWFEFLGGQDVREPAGQADFPRSGDFWKLPPQSDRLLFSILPAPQRLLHPCIGRTGLSRRAFPLFPYTRLFLLRIVARRNPVTDQTSQTGRFGRERLLLRRWRVRIGPGRTVRAFESTRVYTRLLSPPKSGTTRSGGIPALR